MQFFTDLFVTILAFYIALSSGAAQYVTSVFEPEQSDFAKEILALIEENENVPTTIEESAAPIPKILIENIAYQKASIVESIRPEDATSTALDALVNIYCTYRSGDTLHITTGTGYFIDTSGILLTNAHVAQFLLLEDIIGDAECIIRNGNPATPQYVAELLYISPAWIRENAELLGTERPRGTGERDYALLYVTAGIDGTPMPNSFPALPFNTEFLKNGIVGEQVYAAGYPADAFIAGGLNTPLVPKLATTTITELMTFGSNYADVFSIRGSEVGQRGSSGGPVLTQDGKAIGMISTKGDDEKFGEGTLRAITLSYIDRTITEETGFSLRQNLGGNVPYRSHVFKETVVPFLQLLLEQEMVE